MKIFDGLVIFGFIGSNISLCMNELFNLLLDNKLGDYLLF
jgi:hypothetical protein